MTVVKEVIIKEIELSDEQADAVQQCCDFAKRVFAVTGLAGTGKTTILKQVHNELKAQSLANSIVLCAPTGRAAKRIQEATGISAITIHRLLEFPKPSDDDVEIVGVGSSYAPRRNRSRPLTQRVVLVDEASMIGPVLDGQLRDALRRDGIIRYFGDSSQLPPVEEGSPPFRALCLSDHSITLSKNYRSDDEIIGNSLLILRGRMPKRNNRFEIIYTEEPIQAMLSYCDERFTQANNQVIMTMRKGSYGTVRANPSLQIKFNPRGEFLQLDRLMDKEPKLTIKQADKFLWVKNDYNFDLYNGEIGTIDDIDTESGDVTIGLVDRGHILIPPRSKAHGPYGPYHYDPRKQIDLGYAITTHKAQGSEFDTVVYVMSSKGQGGLWMCSRNNFYTGVTRARKNVVVITDRKAMSTSLWKVV
jgi:exodeoxyribonuclease V alpha subunit